MRIGEVSTKTFVKLSNDKNASDSNIVTNRNFNDDEERVTVPELKHNTQTKQQKSSKKSGVSVTHILPTTKAQERAIYGSESSIQTNHDVTTKISEHINFDNVKIVVIILSVLIVVVILIIGIVVRSKGLSCFPTNKSRNEFRKISNS